MAAAPLDLSPTYQPLSAHRKSVLFNPDNVLETVKGVEDWWSEGDRLCRRGGLGYWLAISLEIRRQLQDKYADPDVQKVKLIECWMEHDFASWQWLRRAVQRVGHSYLASLITSYQQHTHTGVAFTCSNVLTAVRTVEDWWSEEGLGYQLHIPEEKIKEIQCVYTDPEEQMRQLVLYWMATDPLASWRRLIRQLDDMQQSPVADSIRDFAEPLTTDASFTLHNIYHTTSTVNYVYLNEPLAVPIPVYYQIEENPSYPTEAKRREAIIQYFLNIVPLASWTTLAGGLYWRDEHISLEAVKKYLHTTESCSVNFNDLNTALETLPEEVWYDFGPWLNVPRSQRDEIRSQYSTARQRKSALLRTYLTYHPAPSWQHVADSLYRSGLHTALARVQAMFPTGRYRAKLIFEQEMEHGHSETDVTKVVMIGFAGSGKSTALDTLMEVEPLAKEYRSSTPIMKRPLKTVVIIVDGKTKWVKKEQDQFTAHLAANMSTEYKPPQETTHSPLPLHVATNVTQSLPTFTQMSSHPPSTHSSPHSSAGITSQSTTTALLQSGPSLPPQLNVDSLLQSTELDEEFVSLISQATSTPKPLAHERWVFLIDSGGQTEFQDAFSVFLPHTSVCVFVFKLSESLDSYPDMEYYRNGRRIGKRQQSLLTNRDIFEKYMRTMFSFNSKAKGTAEKHPANIQGCSPEPALKTSPEDGSSGSLPPRILLLGTHRDLKHLCTEETVEQKNEQLESIIPKKLKEQVIYCEKKRPIFEINGLTPDDDDKKTAEKIRECIMKECPSRRVKTPWRWHILNQKMKSIAHKLQRHVLSREECLKIAQSVKLDKESFELALEFFHSLSIIFYYPKILPNVVFVDPQVLLDKVTELVQFTFELQDPDSTAPCLPLGWQQFDRFAQVSEKFMENKRFSSHYHEPVFTTKHLTTLLEKLLVFARLSPDTWFMPCVLKHLKPHEIQPHCVSRSPMVVHFPDGGPQHGVCCSLISHVLSKANHHPSEWNILEDGDHPACLYRNCIQFQVTGYGGFVMVIDRFTYLEIHVHTSQRKLLELWQHVRDAIFSGLQSVAITLGYSDNKPSPAILCPVHASHPAPVRDGEWICSSTNRFGDIADVDECIPWLEEKERRGTDVPTVSETTAKETFILGKNTSTLMFHAPAALRSLGVSSEHCDPQKESTLNMGDMMEVTGYLKDLNKSQIYNLGLVLGLDYNYVIDRRDNCGSNQDFLDAVVVNWLQKGSGVKVSWAAIVKALQNDRLRQNGIAERISSEHGIRHN